MNRLLEATMVVRALATTGVEVHAAMRRAVEAIDDPRWAATLERRRAALLELAEDDHASLLARADAYGVRYVHGGTLLECLARVEAERELRIRRARESETLPSFEAVT